MVRPMAIRAIPRMTKPWKVVAVVMAVFGFVSGYVGVAGGPLCGSVGQCLSFAAERGIEGFTPGALIPGAISGAILGAFVYVLFLAVTLVRMVLRRSVAAGASDRPSTPHSATSMGSAGRNRRSRPTPLTIAVGAALAWALLTVGPATLLDDVVLVVPVDEVTTPKLVCPADWALQGSTCAPPVFLRTAPFDKAATPYLLCGGTFPTFPTLESDNLCHQRSGGVVDPLVADIRRGATSGLLAFLAVGAALLLWPRLRAASQSTTSPIATIDPTPPR
jgi:hypothetical protein